MFLYSQMVSIIANTNNSILYQSFVCTQWSGYKYCYLTLFILFNTIHLYTVKWFQVFLCITNNSIKHKSLVYTQLNDQRFLFQTIQFTISHLFAQFKHQTVPFDQYIGVFQVLPLQVSGPRSNGNEEVLHIPQISSITWASPSDFFGVISRTLVGGGVLPLCRDAVSVFNGASILGCR